MLTDVLAQIGRELIASIKRLLIKYNYPPDQQPGAIKLVLEQMEQLAPNYPDHDHEAGRTPDASGDQAPSPDESL